MLRILLTGFEPFNKQTVNPSEQVVRRLSESTFPGLELHTSVLAVHRKTGPEKLLRVFSETKPEAALLLGEAGSYAVPTLERVFINYLDYSADLGGGVGAQDEPIDSQGPAAYFSTLPVRVLAQAILTAGLPCRISLSAGSFICNQVGYTLLHHIYSEGLRVPVGFIHLPFLLEQAAKAAPAAAYPSMTLETLCQVVSVALCAIKECVPPVALLREPPSFRG